ncbi:sulfatase family protein [Zobellia galactanivorans]|uniref:sulfatase family protein n=1 Tax=Zobellia galactanivorans (strain DSM 12802 / CCUG 47099 / CIP 106680 / NCIMB 13871 / Dsij) TaxID=63186 RepID=UPI001C074323|nr:sulfatase-like hydrolase/transferase [Zobellia galactanivorans]MBU3024196.1 sulfatase-like hydrolase/transferase [Zobellia galactanivorans]
MKFKFTNIHYILLLATAVLGSSCNSKKAGKIAKADPKPNIIIYLTDDLGYGDLGCYGNPIIQTPGIDKFASEGVLLTDCHSAGTVCSPSRSGLLTGRNPYRSGFYYIQGAYGAHMQNDEVTLAELLKTQGYETAFMGKWHLSRLEKSEKYDEPGPGDQGFDYWFASTHNAFSGPKNYGKFLRNGEEVGETDGWYVDVLTKEATNWLTKVRDKSKPFLLVVSTHEPHTPIAPPEKFSSLYDNATVDSLEQTIKYGGVDRTLYDISSNKKEYYGTVSQLDHAFSDLMKTVEDENAYDNTMVIFTSDNGPEHPVNLEESQGTWEEPIRDYCFGTPGIYRGMKRYPFEGGHRVPGIVRYPAKIPAGTTSDAMVVATDFLPTVATLAQAEIPTDRNMDGKDALSAFLGEKIERDEPYLWLFPTHEDTYFRMPHMAMRYDDYTLLGWFPEKTEEDTLVEWMKSSVPVKFALYNLSTDPGQENDLAASEPETVEKLKPIMIRTWKKIRDEGPDWGKLKSPKPKAASLTN